jgi:hypothetical protein
MRNRDIDKLTRYSFGEVSETEKLQIEAWMAADSEARAEAEKMARISSELHRLGQFEIECSLSAGQLRNAILGADMKQRKWNLNWLPIAAMPVAASILAALFWSNRANNSLNPQPNASKEKLVAAQISAPERTVEKWQITPVPEEFLNRDVADFQSEPAAKENSQHVKNASARVSMVRSTERREPSRRISVSSKSAGTATIAERPQAAIAPDMATDGLKPTEDSVVIIQPDTDGVTGASVAEEVSDSGTVVIGG